MSLAHFGLDSCYVTPRAGQRRSATPPCGRSGPKASATDFVQRGGSRLGIYFAETGASQRASTVVYDRAGASVAEHASRATIDVGDGVRRARRGSTSPASRRRSARRVAACTREAVDAAAGGRRADQPGPQLPREALEHEADAQDVMRPLASTVDVDHRQRGGHPVVPRPRRARRRCHRRAAWTWRGYRDVRPRASSASSGVQHGRHHAAREPTRRAATAGAPRSGTRAHGRLLRQRRATT
ncbi:MAG: hypothetical protein MZV64_72635 [Ignavibacteriales bacterium]|nr:hypothetical protein [Ignavibacteriales bacterium]